jgi:hypothetical protein
MGLPVISAIPASRRARVLCAAALVGALWAAVPAGNASFAWKLYTPINFNLTNQAERLVSIDLYGEQADPWWRQSLERQEIRYNLRPARTNLVTNACGDLSVLAAFRPVRTGWITGTVSYESTTLGARGLDFTPRGVAATFPLPATERTEALSPYLGEDDGVRFAATPLERTATELVCRTKSSIEALAALAAWNHRVLAPESVEDGRRQQAGEVFGRKSGSVFGRLRVLAAMCRAAGIPARFVLGQRVDFDVPVKGGLPWLHPGGRGEAWWVEARIADGVWMPIDPQGTVFFLWPNVIRKKADARLENLFRAAEGFTEHLYEARSQAGSGLSIASPSRPIFAPVSNTGGVGVGAYLALLEKRAILPPKAIWKVDAFSFCPPPEAAVAETLRIEAGAKESWAERFDLAEAATLPAVELLLRRIDSQGGALTLELSREVDGGASPASFRAHLPTWRIGEGGVWRWVRVSLADPKAKAPPSLDAGKWWFTLRLQGEGIIHWAADVDSVHPSRSAWKLGADGKPVLRVDGAFCLRRAGGE